MFKNLKSAIIFYYLYKFRKRFSIVVLLLSLTLLSGFLYADVVEYLKLTKNIEYLTYILPIKWLIILSSITTSAFLVFTIFKKEESEKLSKNINTKKIIPQKESKKEEPEKPKNKDTLSEREKMFMKKKIRSKAEMLLDK